MESLLRESLSNLGLEYVDLYLVHAPFAFKRGEDPVPKDGEGNVIVSIIGNLTFVLLLTTEIFPCCEGSKLSLNCWYCCHRGYFLFFLYF